MLAIIVSCARALLLSFSAQLVLAFLAGVILSAWAVCLAPAVAQLTEEKQRPRAFSLLFSLGIGMGAIGGFAGSRLPAFLTKHPLHIALEPQQIVLLLSCLIVAIGLWPLSKLHFTPPAEPASSHSNRSFALSPFLLRFLPAIAVWSLATGSFSPLASVYLAKGVHLSLQQIGNAFSLSQIAQVAAVLLAPLLFRKWGLIQGILFTQLGTAVMLLLLSSTVHPSSVTVFYIFFCAFQWMNEPGLYSLLMNSVAPADRESASASNSFVISSAQAIAAAMFGSAFAHYGYPGVIRVIAGIAIFAAILFSNLERSKATQTESSAVLG
jgi:predicted MFS family arabinose efflux permease